MTIGINCKLFPNSFINKSISIITYIRFYSQNNWNGGHFNWNMVDLLFGTDQIENLNNKQNKQKISTYLFNINLNI